MISTEREKATDKLHLLVPSAEKRRVSYKKAYTFSNLVHNSTIYDYLNGLFLLPRGNTNPKRQTLYQNL